MDGYTLDHTAASLLQIMVFSLNNGMMPNTLGSVNLLKKDKEAKYNKILV